MQLHCSNPSCRQILTAPDSLIGSRICCPHCNKELTVPAPAMARAAEEPTVVRATATDGYAEVPLYLRVPSITDPQLRTIPPLESFQALNPGERLVKSYQIRVRRPKLRWELLLLAFVFCALLLVPFLLSFRLFFVGRGKEELVILYGLACSATLVLLIGVPCFLITRLRGHTFLYLTNQRVTILELEAGLLRKHQAVCNFRLEDISGFQLLAQRGLKKLLGLLLLKEKRTFYLAITTRTCANVEIGAVRWRHGGKYDPGRDAVTLCSELDSKVLALRTSLPA